MKIVEKEYIHEISIEIFKDRYLVMSTMKNNRKKKIVTGDKKLAFKIMSILSIMQIKEKK